MAHNRIGQATTEPFVSCNCVTIVDCFVRENISKAARRWASKFLCKHGIHEGLYNHLSSDIGRRHIAKEWEKAGIAQLLDESFSLPPEDPFEEIEGSIEIP